MSEIHGILERLGSITGISGAALLTPDGLTIASTLGPEFVDETVAGLSSFLINTTCRSMAEAGIEGGFQRFILNATHGKVVLVEIRDCYLVVITNQFSDLAAGLVKIQAAASDLRRVAKIQI